MANIWFHVVFSHQKWWMLLLLLLLSASFSIWFRCVCCRAFVCVPLSFARSISSFLARSISPSFHKCKCALSGTSMAWEQYSSNPSSTKNTHTPTTTTTTSTTTTTMTESFQWSERNTCTIEEKHLVLVFLTMRTIFTIERDKAKRGASRRANDWGREAHSQNINLGHFAAIFSHLLLSQNINHPPGTQARVQNHAKLRKYTHAHRTQYSTHFLQNPKRFPLTIWFIHLLSISYTQVGVFKFKWHENGRSRTREIG